MLATEYRKALAYAGDLCGEDFRFRVGVDLMERYRLIVSDISINHFITFELNNLPWRYSINGKIVLPFKNQGRPWRINHTWFSAPVEMAVAWTISGKFFTIPVYRFKK